MLKKDLSKILKNIGEEKRLDILCLLFKQQNLKLNDKATSNKDLVMPMCVSAIAKQIKSSIATTSHHLKVLEEIDILESERFGKEICYKIKDKNIIEDIKNLICKNLHL